MKKAIALVLTLTLLAIGCLSAGAATKSAFKQIDTYDGMPMQDNSPKNEKDIFYSDEFGIGNTGAGDWVMFSDVDFGTTGAKEVSLMFTFMVTDYSDFPCTLEIYLDDPDKGKPVGTVSIDEDCGHWMRDAAMWFKGKCDISGGVHDVYVKWKDNTGSLFAIKFTAKDGGKTPATTKAPANTTTKAPANNTTKAPAGTTATKAPDATTAAPDTENTTAAVSADVTEASDTTTTTDKAQDVIAESKDNTESSSSGQTGKNGPSALLIVGIIAAVVIVAGIVVFVVVSQKKKA